MDCITSAHVVYFRGGGIILSDGGDPNYPVLPGEADEVAAKDYRYRAVMLEPVYVEEVLAGKWKGTLWMKSGGENGLKIPCAFE